MQPPVNSESPFVAQFLGFPCASGWENLRRQAEEVLATQVLPTTRQEEWKYTDLRFLQEKTFQMGVLEEPRQELSVVPETLGTRLVFVNGVFHPKLSNLSALPKTARFQALSAAPDLAPFLGTYLPATQSDLFAQLNTARFQDGALLYLPKDLQLKAPLHVVFFTQGGEKTVAAFPRLLVMLEEGASAMLLEEYVGQGEYLNQAVVEVALSDRAQLIHERIQRESPEAIHFNTCWASVDSHARYVCRNVNLGARFSRHNPKVRLAAEGAELDMSSLALLDSKQFSDTHSLIDHPVPRCTARQLHKLVLDGQSRGVFNGKIMVHPNAQHTDARQQARALLLSEDAQVDAKPELEIFADDVKCAHGAAIGQLDAEELFYLQSRGLTPKDARNLLTYGFAAEVLAPIAVESLARQLRRAVIARTQAVP